MFLAAAAALIQRFSCTGIPKNASSNNGLPHSVRGIYHAVTNFIQILRARHGGTGRLCRLRGLSRARARVLSRAFSLVARARVRARSLASAYVALPRIRLRVAPQDPVQQSAALPLGASASALNSRLQALRDVTNRKSGPQRGKGAAAAKPRANPTACTLPADPSSAPATFKPSLTNSRAAAFAERAASPPPAPLEQLPPYALRSPVAGAPHPDIRFAAAPWRPPCAHMRAPTPQKSSLTRTAWRAHRISGSPVVTLSPNGRASNYRASSQASPTAPACHALPAASTGVSADARVKGAAEEGLEVSVCSGGEPQVGCGMMWA